MNSAKIIREVWGYSAGWLFAEVLRFYHVFGLRPSPEFVGINYCVLAVFVLSSFVFLLNWLRDRDD